MGYNFADYLLLRLINMMIMMMEIALLVAKLMLTLLIRMRKGGRLNVGPELDSTPPGSSSNKQEIAYYYPR
jgi:hypothetical protein